MFSLVDCSYSYFTDTYIPIIYLVTIRGLLKRHHLSDVQLDREIEHDDIPLLAEYFDKVQLYLNLMKLSSADKKSVTRTLHAEDTQIAMSQCLSLWKRRDPFKATYLSLLKMILMLKEGEIANNVCLYLAGKNGKAIV